MCKLFVLCLALKPEDIKYDFPDGSSLWQLHRSVGHDQCKLSRTCERFPICDDKITENDRCVLKIIGIHCGSSVQKICTNK